jgi:hypothetical protein
LQHRAQEEVGTGLHAQLRAELDPTSSGGSLIRSQYRQSPGLESVLVVPLQVQRQDQVILFPGAGRQTASKSCAFIGRNQVTYRL